MKVKGKWCGREDSNFHGLSPTTTSTLRVYQFRHDRTSGGEAACGPRGRRRPLAKGPGACNSPSRRRSRSTDSAKACGQAGLQRPCKRHLAAASARRQGGRERTRGSCHAHPQCQRCDGKHCLVRIARLDGRLDGAGGVVRSRLRWDARATSGSSSVGRRPDEPVARQSRRNPRARSCRHISADRRTSGPCRFHMRHPNGHMIRVGALDMI